MKRFALLSLFALLAVVLWLATAVATRAATRAATFTVTTTADSGPGSLRQAILDANANPGTDTITFAIGAAGSQQTITLTGSLPTLSDPVLLDGWSQGGSGYTGPPLIELNGVNLTSGGDRGFRIDSGGTTVRGFAINRFNAVSGSAVWLRRGDGNWIYGNYFGVGMDGATPLPNYYGIWIDNWGNTEPSDNNIIGSNGDGVDDAFEGNVIAASTQEEIRVETSGNWFAGNYIGTDAAGSTALTSAGQGIILLGDNNVVGTNGDGISDALEGNVISGNNDGIGINNSFGHTIAGNIIGLDASGTMILGNSANGINCNASANPSDQIRIGTNGDGISDSLEGNVISGSGSRGYSTFYNNCRHITISGNKIGTNISGTVALGNGADGIIVSAGDWVTITHNIVSGNGTNGSAPGITLGSAANQVTIADNIIGSDATGSADLGNTGRGIEISFSDHAIIRDNQIGGNGGDAVFIAGSDLALIENNLIGVQADGSTLLENDGHGVYIFGDAKQNRVLSNTIAYSGRSGIIVDGNQAISNTLSANAVYNNVELGIDLDFDGPTPTDPDDPDTGPNGLQNHPAIFGWINTADFIVITGTLDSIPNTSFTLEFFSGGACDPSGNGEGALFLGSDGVTTDGNGDAPYNITLPVLVPQGRYLSATATGPEGTSEFSVCVGPTGPVQDTPITGLTAANDGPRLDHNPLLLTATVATGNNITYTWNPGDGSGLRTGRVVTHTYTLPGTYTAVVTAVNSLSQQAATTVVTITRSAYVVGRVWDDYDGDGRRSTGETDFSGELVRVVQNGRTYTDTTTATGTFIVRGLDAGSYTIFSPSISGYRPVGAGVRIRSIPLVGIGYPQDFPYRADFTGVQGRAWKDGNFNGRYDLGDTLLTGHPITLTTVDGSLSFTAATDGNGFFRFNLSANDGQAHRLVGERPFLYENITRTVNGANLNATISNLNYPPGAVGGCVSSAGGGATVTGLTVTLHDAAGQQLAGTATDGSGCYLFTPGDAQGAAGARLTPAAGDLIVGPGAQPAVYLGTPLRVDWDVTAPGNVDVQIYSVDGVPYFSSQHDFSGYEVHLLTGSGLITATTNVDGLASFAGVSPGWVTATLPLSGNSVGVTPSRWAYELPPGAALYWNGFEVGTYGITAECRTPPVPGQEPDGRFFPCTIELFRPGEDPFLTQTLAEGEQFFYQPTTSGSLRLRMTPDDPNAYENLFGFIYSIGDSKHFRYLQFLPEQLGPVSGEVWTDANANGTREADEGPAIGFTVELLSSDGTVLETATTDTYGRYHLYPDSFGVFRVRIAPLSGVLPTTADVRTISRDPGNITGNVVDFGLAFLAQGIEGRVRFSDAWNSNASGLTVWLHTTAGDFIDSTTTGPTGQFSFGSLLPDQYKVTVLPPYAGPPVYRLVTAGVGGTPRQEIWVPADSIQPTVLVYVDENGNEVADAGEGLPNVSVAFDIDTCGNVIDVNETDGDGFAGSDLVFPEGGCARVTGGLPAGLSPAGASGTYLAPYHGGIVPLRVVAEGTLQLRPFWDRNGNGQQDAGEPLRLDDLAVQAPGLTLARTTTQLFLTGPTGTYDNIWVGTRIGTTAAVMRPVPLVGVISSLTENSLSIPLAYTNTLAGVVTGPDSGAVSGRIVYALNENGSVIATAVTGVAPISRPGGRSYNPPPAASGGPATAPFTFYDLPPDTYRLQIADPPPGTAPFGPVDVVHDPAAPTNAVLRLVGVDSVSGVAYWDNDYDGSRDGGEPGTNFYDVVLLNNAGQPPQTITPAADGTFVFTGLQPNVQYALTVPDLYDETASAGNWITESPGWFTMGSWPAVGDIGIGNYGSGNPNSLAVGQVYVQNGTSRDSVPGATVGYYQLQSSSGLCTAANPSIQGQTTSDGDGRYRLPLVFVPNGSVKYCLVVLSAPGLIQNDPTVIADAAVRYNLPGGRIIYDQALNLNMDIKMRLPAGGQRSPVNKSIITWATYRDDNLNGTWDAGEVPLTGAILGAGPVTATSGPGGSGVLTVTVAGEQALSVTSPAGTVPVGPATRTAWLSGGDLSLPPIGFVPDGAAYGLLFVDKDGDGWPGSGGEEVGLGGVTVTLIGPVVTTAVTTPDGRFALRGLPDGNYTVSAAVPDGYTAESAALTVSGGAGIVRLPAQSTAHLSGALYEDWDGDGVRLADEGLVTAVPLTVTVPGVGSTRPLGGSVLFWDVAPGSYVVQPVWEAAVPVNITLGENDGGGFGLPAVPPGMVRGTVWFDANGDGERQPWEAPLSGVTVMLDGGASVVTDENGRYTFANVPAGSHVLTTDLPGDLGATIPPVVVTDGRGAAAGIAVSAGGTALFLPIVTNQSGN